MNDYKQVKKTNSIYEQIKQPIIMQHFVLFIKILISIFGYDFSCEKVINWIKQFYLLGE